MGQINKLITKRNFDETYMSLARNSALWELKQKDFLSIICKNIADTLNVEHIAIYLLDKKKTQLSQIIHYSLSRDTFSSGLGIKKEHHPLYFESLSAFRIIDAADAQHDIRTREFSSSYITPQGIGAMLDCSLHHAGHLAGVISAEHIGKKRKWKEDEKSFLIAISDLVSQRLLFDEINSTNLDYNELSAFDEIIVNSSRNCIISIDKKGRIKTANQFAIYLLGYDNESELLNKDFFSSVLVKSEEIDDTKYTITTSDIFNVQALRKNFENGIQSNCEAFFQHLDGDKIPVSLTISTLKDTLGKLKGHICIATDISDSLNSSKALKEKEAHYRLVFENTADSMFLMKDAVFTECNQATLKMFACTKEQILNQTPYQFSPKFQPDGKLSEEKSMEMISAALTGETQFFEWQHCRLDGSLFNAEVTLNMVLMHGESYLLASVRDISQRKISEAELKKSREKIIEHSEALALINTLSNQLYSTDSIDEIYAKTVDTLEWMPLSPRIAIYTIDNEAKVMHFKMGIGHEPGTEEEFKTIPLNPNFNAVPLQTGEPIYSSDISSDERLIPEIKEKLLEAGINSMVEIPFVYQENKMAVAILSYEIENALSSENLEILFSIGKTVSLALANAVSRKELGYIAHHDSLTGLANRAMFHKQFKATILTGGYESVALYLLDLDRFKEINDTLGHFTGDKILQQIGPRLKSIIKDHAVLVSRLGGDEFIVLVYGVKENTEAERIAKIIINNIQIPFPIDDLNLEIDTSVGIAIYPKDGMDSHALLRSADVAMYQAKQQGTGFAFYEQHTDIHTPERLAMIAELGGSINSGQLFLHYQPKIDLQTNQVVGFEALARWEHPRLGSLAPSMFVPLIEMSNSIFQLTEEVLHQALSQQMQWRKEGFHYSVAVNLSARNLIDDRIIGLLKDMLDYYDTPAGLLELEITETALMHDAYRATDYLKRIADLGIQLSIDDFGTGYSSLAYLHTLPIHKLKLDRKFIMGMLTNKQGRSIVETIITLSNILELDVVAEGVEDQETLEKLKQMNCDQAQGYHICRPNTWDQIQLWLNK